ncbi:NAD(P)/FAD-dependent oxidoreductase [Thiosulfativibrio zosterae]|uniref:Membrane protein n=1 Tax=Thiosulfativibrio zosterae TaxID=2675053 RepID=A0A6F8PQJ8_9GAMM|nr:NAD(P)/FAD-dependent oxidoreductase [Thiosulfativibrio zosterae]BBP44356.1 membrane protein [Thiosulfativibrio zosterae]
MTLNSDWDVIIIGAGASGIMCATTAGYRGKSVLVLDHAPKAAAKIRISGGGKCNFTNLTVTPNHYLCQNPHFVKSALARYQPQDFIDLVDRHGLAYEERDLGKLFCAERASDLIQILRTEADWAGVEFLINTPIESVSYTHTTYQIKTPQQTFNGKSLVIATGALSFPKLKATGLGYDIAEQFGLKIIQKSPGLVPLIFEGRWADFCQNLTGIALEVAISIQNQRFQEALLFTHQGMSGPAILQTSNYWQKGMPLSINLLPRLDLPDEFKMLKKTNGSLTKFLNQYWPKKLTQAWLNLHPFDNLANQSDEAIEAYAQLIANWQVYPSDKAGYDKAEVTLGGVNTDEVSSKTFEAFKQPGLYFIGEVLDVTGHLGGYNFQWAWASGFACGQSLP